MAITISGNGITSANIADGTITNADINASAAIDGSKISGDFGKVLQVVHANNTSKISVSLNTWATGVSATITPSATTSKILIIATLSANLTGSNVVGTRFLRDATVIGSLTGTAQYMSAGKGGTWRMRDLTNNYLDSPNTTSPITYAVQGFGHENTLTLNSTSGDNLAYPTGDSDAASNIVLMEIAG